MAKTIYVSNAAELNAALANRKGDTILVLASGNYGAIDIDGRKGGTGSLTITSANGLQPATFEDLSIRSVSGVKLDGLQFAPTKAADEKFAGYGLTLRDTTGVTVSNSSFEGGPNGFDHSAYGFTVTDSQDVTFQNNDFGGLFKGGVMFDSANVKLVGNTVTNLRSDGFDLAGVNGVEIAGNHFSSFHPVAGDHADFIQFLAMEGGEASSNITIRDNTFLKGSGDAVQSIFMNNKAASAYTNVVIENNFIEQSSSHGITVVKSEGLVIRNNTVLSTADSSNKVSITVSDSVNVKVAANTADAYNVASGNSGLTQADNFLRDVGPTTSYYRYDITNLKAAVWTVEGGKGADDIAAKSGVGGTFLNGHEGNDVLRGGKKDDVLDGGQGNDTLCGGEGADRFAFDARDIAPVKGKAGQETDVITDLNFGQGDAIQLSHFGSDIIKAAEKTGHIDVLYDKGAATGLLIDSWADIADLTRASVDVYATQKGKTDVLLLTIKADDASVETIAISNGWANFMAAGGEPLI